MRRLTISDMDFGIIRSRLVSEKNAQLFEARETRKSNPEQSEEWSKEAAETHRLIALMDTAETL